MPGSGTRHLRSMVGNNDSFEVVALQNGEDPDHIHLAFVDERLAVVRHLADYVAKMKVGNLALPAVLVDRIVNVSFRHFGDGSHAKFQGIGTAWNQVEQTLIHMRLENQTRLAAHGGHGRIVRMGRQSDSGLLGNRQEILKKSLQPAPEFFVGNRREGTGRRVPVIDHVPDLAVRDGLFIRRPIHSQGQRASATRGRGHAPADACQAEVVSQDWNARVSHPANDGLHILDVLRTPRAIEENVMPVSRIEILDRRQRQACILDFLAEGLEFGNSPKFLRIAGHSPRLILGAGGLIMARIGRALVEIVDQMNHHMRAACLPREIVILARQHVAVQPQAHLHKRFPIPDPKSALRICPLISAASGEHKKIKASAIDSGLLRLPRETRRTNSRYAASSSKTLRELPAATFPGEITFTRMPDDAYSRAMQRAKFSSAALAEA